MFEFTVDLIKGLSVKRDGCKNNVEQLAKERLAIQNGPCNQNSWERDRYADLLRQEMEASIKARVYAEVIDEMLKYLPDKKEARKGIPDNYSTFYTIVFKNVGTDGWYYAELRAVENSYENYPVLYQTHERAKMQADKFLNESIRGTVVSVVEVKVSLPNTDKSV